MTRPRIVAGNWKMNTTRSTAVALARAVVDGLGAEDRVQVAVCPPFVYLAAVAEALAGSRVALGAQNCYFHPEGAYTGEVSPRMLIDVGCRYVLVGHSERRHVLQEREGDINRKLHAALGAGLSVILCVGETFDERKEGWVGQIFYRQVASALAGLTEPELSRLIIAYEPVWAIGTGQTATPAQAQEAHAFIRQFIARTFGENVAASLPILYGGSVKPDNAQALFHQPDVDGGLIGGASLDAGQFLAIVRAAERPAK